MSQRLPVSEGRRLASGSFSLIITQDGLAPSRLGFLELPAKSRQVRTVWKTALQMAKSRRGASQKHSHLDTCKGTQWQRESNAVCSIPFPRPLEAPAWLRPPSPSTTPELAKLVSPIEAVFVRRRATGFGEEDG